MPDRCGTTACYDNDEPQRKQEILP